MSGFTTGPATFSFNGIDLSDIVLSASIDSPTVTMDEVRKTLGLFTDPDYDPRLDVLDWDTEPEWSKYAVARRHATEDEMREARALARSNLPPDPVEAILGHRADHIEGAEDDRIDDVLHAASWPSHNQFVVQCKADIEPFVDAWRDIAAMWRTLPIVYEQRSFLHITDA